MTQISSPDAAGDDSARAERAVCAHTLITRAGWAPETCLRRSGHRGPHVPGVLSAAHADHRDDVIDRRAAR